MEGALRASIEGLERVDQARKRRGWNRQSVAWAEAALTTVASLKLFWRRERLNREAFIGICAAISVDWKTVADSHLNKPRSPTGEAPELTFFCGRTEELQTLERWVTGDRCKVVMVLGMGGMGKTTLAVQLVDRVLDQFEFVVWRSLRNAPAPPVLLTDVLQALGDLTIAADHLLLSRLMTALRQHRCLLVLDNAETVLHAEGDYEAGYDEYGELIRRVGEERHRSCLLLTSREQSREMTRLDGDWGDRYGYKAYL